MGQFSILRILIRLILNCYSDKLLRCIQLLSFKKKSEIINILLANQYIQGQNISHEYI